MILTSTKKGMLLSCLMVILLAGSLANKCRAPTDTSIISSMYTPSWIFVLNEKDYRLLGSVSSKL